MHLGKVVLFFIFTHICANSWWFFATQLQGKPAKDFVAVPILSTLGTVAMVLFFVIDTWSQD